MTLIDPSRNLAALEAALPLFIARAASQAQSDLQQRRAEMRRATALNPERLEQLSGGPSISYAVELWIGHLAYLDLLGSVATLRMSDLTGEEARGLALLRSAREKFWSEHSRCPRCGAVNGRYSQICGGGCGGKLDA